MSTNNVVIVVDTHIHLSLTLEIKRSVSLLENARKFVSGIGGSQTASITYESVHKLNTRESNQI